MSSEIVPQQRGRQRRRHKDPLCDLGAEPNRWQRRLVALAVPAIAFLAPFLGGSTERWSQGLILALIGSCLILDPPRSAPNRAIPWFIGAFLLLAATALVPHAWVYGSGWLDSLGARLGIPLPGTLSPQPAVSGETLVLVVAGVAWWWWLSVKLQGEVLREAVVRSIAVGIIALAVIALLVYGQFFRIPFWRFPDAFGPFPNHNQMADVLATWGLMALACASIDFQRRHWAAWVWLGGTFAILAALIVAYSRAGIVLFFCGIFLWILLESVRRGSVKRFAVATSVAICALTLFLTFGGETLDRFRPALRGVDKNTLFRFAVYQDTLDLIRHAPWCGVGLGNFESLFPLYRNRSGSPEVILHPESDWLWLTSEMGWMAPALILAAALSSLGNPIRRTVTGEASIGTAAFVAAACFAVHGLVDVSGHRLGSAIPGLLLLAVACQKPIRPTFPSKWRWPLSFRAAGLAFVAIAVIWIGGTVDRWELPGTLQLDRLTAAAQRATGAGAFDRATELANQGMRISPVDWKLYYLRGQAILYSDTGSIEDAAADLKRARQLSPYDTELPMKEAQMWLYFDPPRCLEVWQDALRRNEPYRDSVFRQIIGMAGGKPELQSILREIAGDDPQLILILCEAGTADEFLTEKKALLARDPTLSTFTPGVRKILFALWDRFGGASSLVQFVSRNPSYEPECWQVMAREFARTSDYRKAVSLAMGHLEVPPLPKVPLRSLPEAQRDYFQTPQDFAAGYQLIRAYESAGDLKGALFALDRVAALPKSPSYLRYLRTALLAQSGEDAAAWKQLEPQLK